MRRAIVAALFSALSAGWAGSVSAVSYDEVSHYVRSGYKRNCDWPWPYICPDRMAAREPFEIMVRNGWRRQNMLGSHHFNPGTNKLTTAGELHVRWIMTQAPESRRQVFVERSIDPMVTAERLAATREFTERAALDGRVPSVTETNLVAEGRPAATIDWINVKYLENMPPPTLPDPQGSARN